MKYTISIYTVYILQYMLKEILGEVVTVIPLSKCGATPSPLFLLVS